MSANHLLVLIDSSSPLCYLCAVLVFFIRVVLAAEPDLITGSVQSQDLRRVDQVIVLVRDQEGNIVAQGVTNQAGDFTITAPQEGTYSVSAVQDTYKSEFVVVKIGTEPPAPVALTLGRNTRDRFGNRVATFRDSV